MPSPDVDDEIISRADDVIGTDRNVIDGSKGERGTVKKGIPELAERLKGEREKGGPLSTRLGINRLALRLLKRAR